MAPMKRGNAIVAGTDLSESSDEAIREADRWSRELAQPLVVAHFIHESIHNNPLFPQRNELEVTAALELERRIGDAVTERVTEVTGRAPGDFRVVVATGRGDAGLLALADEVAASLIVVGSRGATGLARLLLGSVAERVAQYAHCPVLIARPHVEGGKVIAATDFSDPSYPAVTAAAEAAQRRGEKLVLLHSLDVFPSPAMGIGAPFGASWVTLPQETLEEMRGVAKRMLAESLARLNAEGEQMVTDGPAPAAIVRAAEDLGADLVVVGTRGRSGIGRLVLGSVATQVVRLAPCSVLVVRLLAPQA